MILQRKVNKGIMTTLYCYNIIFLMVFKGMLLDIKALTVIFVVGIQFFPFDSYHVEEHYLWNLCYLNNMYRFYEINRLNKKKHTHIT